MTLSRFRDYNDDRIMFKVVDVEGVVECRNNVNRFWIKEKLGDKRISGLEFIISASVDVNIIFL